MPLSSQVSNAADRMEDFVRSRRAHSRDAPAAVAADTLHEELLASAPADASEAAAAPASALPTRQKKSASAPVVFVPHTSTSSGPSMDQLEDAVGAPPAVCA